jgi:molybdate transport system ATP-binding protein
MSRLEFQARLALGDFRLDAAFVTDRQVVALFGPSGSGKSTILRLIAGLARPDAGRIVLNGHVVFDSAAGTDVATRRRRVGLVFQDGLLFPHLSVRRNLLYSAWVRRVPRPDSWDATIAILDIGHLLNRAPRHLSGGERQRVAIGRALLSAPDILLMDEPVTAIDQERRAEILPYLQRLARESTVPLIYVSHALPEIEALADQIVRIQAGRVRSVEVIRHPQSQNHSA